MGEVCTLKIRGKSLLSNYGNKIKEIFFFQNQGKFLFQNQGNKIREIYCQIRGVKIGENLYSQNQKSKNRGKYFVVKIGGIFVFKIREIFFYFIPLILEIQISPLSPPNFGSKNFPYFITLILRQEFSLVLTENIPLCYSPNFDSKDFPPLYSPDLESTNFLYFIPI